MYYIIRTYKRVYLYGINILIKFGFLITSTYEKNAQNKHYLIGLIGGTYVSKYLTELNQ